MYFVDRAKIEAMLCYLETNLQLFQQQKTWNNELEKKALERIAQVVIETILDVGNAMIDGFIMRDPGSYEDIIDILLDEKVLTESDASAFKEVIFYRKNLVQDYLDIDIDQLVAMLQHHFTTIYSFSTSIRTYLENELGPVSAFKK